MPPDLPFELIQHILFQAALISPSTALSVCLVCHAAYSMGKYGLDSYVSIRSRHDLISSLLKHTVHPNVTAIFVNNRDSVSLANPISSASIDVLQQPLYALRSIQSHDSHSHTVQQVNALAKCQPSELLARLLSCCPHVQKLYVWEPFSINYPPEISEVNHLSAYPLDTYAQTQQQIHARGNLSAASPHHSGLPALTELTISFLALQPRHFAFAIDTPSGSFPVFFNLTHLHLHWPVVTPELVDTLSSLPKLAHLRLSRPSPNGLLQGMQQWLCLQDPSLPESQHGFKFHRIVVELGLYLEQSLIHDLERLESQSRICSRYQAYQRLVLLAKSNDRSRFTGQWLQFDQAVSWQEWKDRLEGRPACWIYPCYCQSQRATSSP